MVGIAFGIHTLYKLDVMVGGVIDWLLSFKATCKPGQSSYEKDWFGNKKELVCKESSWWPFVDTINDMIAGLATITGEATDTIKNIAYLYVFLQQFTIFVTSTMITYTKLISMLRESGDADQAAVDRAKKALKESQQINSMMIDNSEKIKLQLEDAPSQGNTKTGRVINIGEVPEVDGDVQEVDGGGKRRNRNTLRRRKATKKVKRTRRR